VSRRLVALLFLFGTALLVLLLHHVGLAFLLDNVRRTGWMLAPIGAVYAGVYACNALACWLVMADLPGRPPYGKTLLIMVSGFALSSVTPFVQLGGEPYKVGALSPWLGTQRATGTVLSYYMLNTLSNLLTWLVAIAAVLALFRPAAPTALGLAALAAALLLLLVFVFSRHRAGVFGAGLRLLGRLPLLRRLGPLVERRRDSLLQLDEQIVGFYRRSPRRFALALAIDFAGRTIGMLEYFLIARSVGVPIGFVKAFVMGSFLTLGLNVLFFMPFDLGSREGGTALIFGTLGLPSSLGLYAGIVTRLRWALWAAIGLALMWGVGRREQVSPAVTTGGA